MDRIDQTTRLSLLLRVRDHRDEVAWREFVHVYNPGIQRWCQRMGLQAADADDIAQRVLQKLIDSMRSFQYDPQRSFRAWLQTVTRNAVLDFLRAESRRRDIASGDTRLQPLLEHVKSHSDGDRVHSLTGELINELSGRMQLDLVHQAEDKVRPRVQANTWSAYQARRQGQPARQVASDLGMPVAAVHKAKSRVVQLIREEIAKLVASSGEESPSES